MSHSAFIELLTMAELWHPAIQRNGPNTGRPYCTVASRTISLAFEIGHKHTVPLQLVKRRTAIICGSNHWAGWCKRGDSTRLLPSESQHTLHILELRIFERLGTNSQLRTIDAARPDLEGPSHESGVWSRYLIAASLTPYFRAKSCTSLTSSLKPGLSSPGVEPASSACPSYHPGTSTDFALWRTGSTPRHRFTRTVP